MDTVRDEADLSAGNDTGDHRRALTPPPRRLRLQPPRGPVYRRGPSPAGPHPRRLQEALGG